MTARQLELRGASWLQPRTTSLVAMEETCTHAHHSSCAISLPRWCAPGEVPAGMPGLLPVVWGEPSGEYMVRLLEALLGVAKALQAGTRDPHAVGVGRGRGRGRGRKAQQRVDPAAAGAAMQSGSARRGQ